MKNKNYVTENYDGSFGKDRRITKLISDIKKLSEQKTDNQVMKVTWFENLEDKEDAKYEDSWYKVTAYDHDFAPMLDNAPSGLFLRKDGQGWIQQLELIDRWGYGHHLDNQMANYFYKDVKVELLDVPKHEEYVEECELCVVWTGGIVHGMEDACADTW